MSDGRLYLHCRRCTTAGVRDKIAVYAVPAEHAIIVDCETCRTPVARIALEPHQFAALVGTAPRCGGPRPA